MADLVIVKCAQRQMRNLGEGVIEIYVPLTRQERLTIQSTVEEPCLVLRLDAATIKRLRNGSV